MTGEQTSRKPKRRITFRRVTIERVGEKNEPVVFCPRKLAVMQVTECRGCERFSGLCVNPNEGDSFLRCAFGDDEPVGSEAPHDGDHDLPIGVVRAPVSEIMSAPVRCASTDMQLEDLAALFLSERVGALPVIDESGHPVGIVSKTDTMERYYDHAESTTFAQALEVIENVAAPVPDSEAVTAFDIMTRAVFSVGPQTAISRVAALMAYERVHHVLVLSASDDVLGIVSTLDIARWVARSDGYVVPRRGTTPFQS